MKPKRSVGEGVKQHVWEGSPLLCFMKRAEEREKLTQEDWDAGELTALESILPSVFWVLCFQHQVHQYSVVIVNVCSC